MEEQRDTAGRAGDLDLQTPAIGQVEKHAQTLTRTDEDRPTISRMSVVVGYVPDNTGLLAVRLAAQEASWRGTDVVIINIIGAAGYTHPTAADEKTLDALDAELTGLGVAHEIRTVQDATGTRPAEVLLSVAEESEADLVVVGLKRTSAVAKAVLGSTAQRVLMGSPCPVLTVRSAD